MIYSRKYQSTALSESAKTDSKQGVDGTEFDYPTKLSVIDNQDEIFIKGFLTLDQASDLAKAIRR